MFEVADRLVGIYKTQNCTKSITINPGNSLVPMNIFSLNLTATFLNQVEEQQPMAQLPQKQPVQKPTQKTGSKKSTKEIEIEEKENHPEKEKGPAKRNELILEKQDGDNGEGDEEEHTKKKQKVQQGAKKKSVK